jgi:hypothetical protein
MTIFLALAEHETPGETDTPSAGEVALTLKHCAVMAYRARGIKPPRTSSFRIIGNLSKDVFLRHIVFCNIHKLYLQSTQYILLYSIIVPYTERIIQCQGHCTKK